MDMESRYPAIADMRAAAKRRIPHFLWEYLDSANGSEASWRRAEAALDALELMPAILAGEPEPDFSVELLGHRYDKPFGVAPIGMAGAVWPDAEGLLADAAHRANIPFCLSTVAAVTPEDMANRIGQQGWFQLYPPRDEGIRRDMLARAAEAGFHTLVLTADVPALSWREREKRVGLKNPMRVSPRVAYWSALRPAWALKMVGRPIPRPRTMDRYSEGVKTGAGHKHIGLALRTAPDFAYLEALRNEWNGPLVVKGVLDPSTVRPLLDTGVDALWVSNHGGRQFEAAPAPLAQLPFIRAEAGPETTIIYDGAIRSGTDILRANALGADFSFLGRPFLYAVACGEATGLDHLVWLLTEQMRLDMAQLGIARPKEARARLVAN